VSNTFFIFEVVLIFLQMTLLFDYRSGFHHFLLLCLIKITMMNLTLWFYHGQGQEYSKNFGQLNINSIRHQSIQIDLSWDDIQRLLDLFQYLQVGSFS